jgi:hypothetical protein
MDYELHTAYTTKTSKHLKPAQGFGGVIRLLSDALDYLCSKPSMWLEQPASIAFIGTELLHHYRCVSSFIAFL